MILALALSPSLDVTLEVDELRLGEITRPERATRVAGGKTLNAARVAAQLGADVRAVAALGGHTGSWIAELLIESKIPLTSVAVPTPTRICTAVVEREGGATSTDLYEAPTPIPETAWDGVRRALLEAIEPGCWVAHSGSVPAEPGPAAAASLLREARRRGARIAVDSSGEGLRACAPHADLLKVNLSEAAELIGGSGGSADRAAACAAARAAACAAELHERYGCDAVVTDGVRGGAAVFSGSSIALPPPARTGRFPAGSGDAFLGGLLAGLEAGLDAGAALDHARAAAEHNALVPGQGLLG